MMLGTTITALNVDYANDPELQESIEMLGIDEDVMIKSAAILAGIGSLFIPGFTALISTIIYLVIAKIIDRKSTRLNSSHVAISYAVFCLKKKKYDEHVIPFQNKDQSRYRVKATKKINIPMINYQRKHYQ